MSAPDFKAFFSTAYGQDRQPYDYQCRLADLPCESRLISIPSGLVNNHNPFTHEG